jgi:hypothetical protein
MRFIRMISVHRDPSSVLRCIKASDPPTCPDRPLIGACLPRFSETAAGEAFELTASA